jgi:hypothetical protein
MSPTNTTDEKADGTNPWRHAFLELESEIRDLKRAVQIALFLKQDDDRGSDEEGLVWFSIECAQEKAKALIAKWETLHEEVHRAAGARRAA